VAQWLILHMRREHPMLNTWFTRVEIGMHGTVRHKATGRILLEKKATPPTAGLVFPVGAVENCEESYIALCVSRL